MHSGFGFILCYNYEDLRSSYPPGELVSRRTVVKSCNCLSKVHHVRFGCRIPRTFQQQNHLKYWIYSSHCIGTFLTTPRSFIDHHYTTQPSIAIDFLRFAEWYLSMGKTDKHHCKSMSFKNYSLTLIPGSLNSKKCANVLLFHILFLFSSEKIVLSYVFY